MLLARASRRSVRACLAPLVLDADFHRGDIVRQDPFPNQPRLSPSFAAPTALTVCLPVRSLAVARAASHHPASTAHATRPLLRPFGPLGFAHPAGASGTRPWAAPASHRQEPARIGRRAHRRTTPRAPACPRLFSPGVGDESRRSVHHCQWLYGATEGQCADGPGH